MISSLRAIDKAKQNKYSALKKPAVYASDNRVHIALETASNWILKQQLPDGGFSISSIDKESVGALPTAQAICALLSLDNNLLSSLHNSIKWLESIHQNFLCIVEFRK